jgi:putative hydroxymethylpyrimidine transporter CytX
MKAMEAIKPVEKKERYLNSADYFIIWAGAAISLAEVLAGGILLPLGFTAAMLAIFLGHVIGNTPLALGQLIGSEQGIPAMVSIRTAFGIRGSYLASILNIIQLAGWTAIMIIIGASSANAISQEFGLSNIYLWTVIIGAVTTAWSFIGKGYWKLLERIAVILLALLLIYITYAVFAGYAFKLFSHQGDGELSFAVALDIVIAMPLSWLPLAADYSRFSKDVKKSAFGTWLGYFLVSSWMYAVGYCAAVATGNADIVPMMLALGFSTAALFIVLFSTFTTTFMDIYSAAISTLNILPKLSEKKGILIYGTVGTLIALVFPVTQYEYFLLLIGSVFSPLFGIVLFDYFIMRKRKLELEELYKAAESKYWYKNGVNIFAITAWLVGVITYQLCYSYALWIGSSLPSLIAAGLLYILLMKFRRI